MSAEYKQLCAEFERPNADLTKIGELLKVCLSEYVASNVSIEYQNILEIGCLWAAHSRNGPAFERYFCQLASIVYFVAGQPLEKVSGQRKWLLIGLQLLNLLVTGRIAEFHILMEQLPEQCLLSNQFIMFPLKLEQSLIEGTFHRIWEAKKSAPAVEYGWFIDGLVDTIRNELIREMESSMTVLSVDELCTVLLIEKSNSSSIEHLAKQRGWLIEGNLVTFRHGNNLKKKAANESTDLSRVLHYARHLEQII